MGAKSDYYDNALLKLIFETTLMANLAQNATSAPLTNLYVSLHTSSPGSSGNQNTNEAAYGAYARVAVVRTSSGWTVTGNSVSPANPITFPTASSGLEVETYFGVGELLSGAGNLLYFGPVAPTISVSAGITPQLTVASVVTES